MGSVQPRYVIPSIAMALVVLSSAAPSRAETGYERYHDWLGWARLGPGEQAHLASSYDRTGANTDYSHYESPEGLVTEEVVATIKTLDGPGILNRIWMPHLTSNRTFVIRMYFDGEATPRIDTLSTELFGGNLAYVSAPLVETCAGGLVCYEPIPFSQSLRIETINHELPPAGWSGDRHYYQYALTTYPTGTPLNSYNGVLSPQQQTERDSVVDMFNQAGDHPAGSDPGAVEATTTAATVSPGDTLALLATSGPGLVRRITLCMPSATDAELDGLNLVISYDSEASPAIDLPVSQFFGVGHQRAAFKSLPLGTDDSGCFYCYWPIPFRDAVSVGLRNESAGAILIDSAVVEYKSAPVEDDLCYLRAHAFTENKSAGQIYHPILSGSGRGHYVGNLLFVEQQGYTFNFLEGDEVITVDGSEVHYGTGLEDAYNGGYYYNWVGAQSGEPEGPMPQSATRPLNGILFVHREAGVEYARADQYRWYIADRIPFSDSIEVDIQNQYALDGSEWTSVAFWYQQPRLDGDIDDDGDVDEFDTVLFVQVLLGLDTVPDHVAAADINGNGSADGDDIRSFIAILAS